MSRLPRLRLFHRLLMGLGMQALWTSVLLAQPSVPVDVLIVERPRALRAYNRYHQELTPEEGALFQPYRPLIVVKTDERLSDNFTRSMVIRIDRTTFYLEKEDQNRLTYAAKAGAMVLVSQCEVLSDTIRVLRNIDLTRMPAAPLAGTRIEAGTLVRRLYRKGGKDYVQSLSASGDFGWGRFDAKMRGTAWESASRPYVPVATQTGASIPDLRKYAEQRIAEVNTVLRDLFGLLNRQTDQSRQAPQWRIIETNGRLSLALDDAAYAHQFSESAQYLLNDLDGPARQLGYSVRYTDGVIQVTRNP